MTLSKKDREDIYKIVNEESKIRLNDDTLILVLAIVLSFMILLFSFGIYNVYFDKTQDQELRAFELEKYNFTEEECVEKYDEVRVSDPRVCERWMTDGSKRADGWINPPETDYICFKCAKYCHQTQVKVGEECRNETIPAQNLSGEVHCSNGSDGFSRCWQWYSYTEKYNKTVCTPTYRTERGFCASVDLVNKAREMGK